MSQNHVLEKARFGTDIFVFEVPKYIFHTDSFPKTPSGKVQRFKLREEAMRRLEGKL